MGLVDDGKLRAIADFEAEQAAKAEANCENNGRINRETLKLIREQVYGIYDDDDDEAVS